MMLGGNEALESKTKAKITKHVKDTINMIRDEDAKYE